MSVHEAGVSVRGRIGVSEKEVRLADYPDRIVDWPGKVPRTAKTKAGKTASLSENPAATPLVIGFLRDFRSPQENDRRDRHASGALTNALLEKAAKGRNQALHRSARSR